MNSRMLTKAMVTGLVCIAVAPLALADDIPGHGSTPGVSIEPIEPVMRQCCWCLCSHTRYGLFHVVTCRPVNCLDVPYQPPEWAVARTCPPGRMTPEECEDLGSAWGPPSVGYGRGTFTREIELINGSESGSGIDGLPVVLNLDADGAAELTADLLAPGSTQTSPVALQSFALARISLAARHGTVVPEARDVLREALLRYYESGAADEDTVLQVQLADALSVVCDVNDELADLLIEELVFEVEEAVTGIRDTQVHAFILNRLTAISAESVDQESETAPRR